MKRSVVGCWLLAVSVCCKMADGAVRTLPLKILPAAEQRRLKVIAGQDMRTAKERQRAKLLDYELRRIDLRLQAGEITEAEAASLRVDARASATFELKGKTK